VWTDKDTQLYFQVHDQNALERWVDWFNGEDRPDNIMNNERQDNHDNSIKQPRNNKMPSISTLGGASSSPFNETSTNGITSTTSSTNNAIDTLLVPRSSVYHHQSSQHFQHYPPSIMTPAATNADHTDTYNFYGAPPHHNNDSNPISTFGVNHDGQHSADYSY
jgi:hypothetical protein